jgi:hypothetical protein
VRGGAFGGMVVGAKTAKIAEIAKKKMKQISSL